MKKLFTIIFGILLTISNLYSQGGGSDFRFLHPKPNPFSLSTVEILTPTKWLAGGSAGTYMVTTDAGSNWNVRYFFRNDPLVSVTEFHFFNENVGLVACSDGFIGRTTNGGLSWDSIPSGTTTSVRSFYFLDDLYGFAVGSGGYLAKTTNGGLSWTLMNSSVTTIIYDVCALDTSNIYFGTQNGAIYVTNNGGNTWTSKNIGENRVINNLLFVNPNIGFAVTVTAIWRTTDGGSTWVKRIGSSSHTWFDIEYAKNVNDPQGNNVIYFTGHNSATISYLYRTYDNGVTMDSINMREGRVAFGQVLSLRRKGDLIISGNNIGMVAYSPDKGNTWFQAGEHISQASLLDVEFHKPSRKIWAGGVKQGIQPNPFYSTDFGNTWKAPLTDCPFQINSLLFINDQVGFAGGTSRRLYRTTNGGVNWDSCAIPAGSSNFWEVFNSSPTTIWAVGGNGFVVRSTNTGNSWEIMDPQTTTGTWGGCALDSNTIFIVGGTTSRGFIKRSTNRGLTWDSLAISTSTQLRHITFISPQIGFTAGDGGLIYKTTDGGNSWTRIFSPVTGTIERIEFLNENTGFITYPRTTGFSMARTTNGGSTWEPVGFVPNNTIGNNFRVINRDSVIVVQSAGIVSLLFDPASIPVEMNTFYSTVSNNTVSLFWSTATELNNSGFEIERKSVILSLSKDDNWTKIAFIPGKGTSSERNFYSFVDENLQPGSYNYRLRQIDFDGSVNVYNLTETVNVGVVDRFQLSQNYPNPFNPSTVINYQLKVNSKVVLKVYDVLGNEVATLVDEVKPAGYHSIEFDGSRLSSGVYFYSIKAGDYFEVKKMSLIK